MLAEHESEHPRRSPVRSLAALRPLTLYERAVAYGAIGLCVEVIFTAVYEVVWGAPDVRLQGHTYLWMHPIWAFGLLVVERYGLAMKARGRRWPVRALVYMTGAFAVEFSTGYVLTLVLGRAPWDYTGEPASVAGLIRLDYAGGWAMAGIVSERITAAILRVRW